MNLEETAKCWYCSAIAGGVALSMLVGILLQKYLTTGEALIGVIVLMFLEVLSASHGFKKRYSDHFEDLDKKTTGDGSSDC